MDKQPIDVVYNQIETDYAASLETAKARIPADIAYLRQMAHCADDAELRRVVSVPGVVTRDVTLLSSSDAHAVVVFGDDSSLSELSDGLGYVNGALFVNEANERRTLDTPDLESVQVAQAIRLVLLQVTPVE